MMLTETDFANKRPVKGHYEHVWREVERTDKKAKHRRTRAIKNSEKQREKR